MKLKQGVLVLGLRPEMLLGVLVANSVYEKHGHEMCITSVVDGRHSQTSLHYAGQAVDLRTRDFSTVESGLITMDLRDALTEEYDVVEESTHIHIEFQPKRK